LENRVVGDGSQYAEGAAGISRDFRYPSEWPSPWGRNYPIRSKQLPHVEGGCCGTDFNLETISSLHPNLILTFNSKTELPTYQKMRDMGIDVLILDPANVSGILHDITLIGRATGAVKQAALVTKIMKNELASVRRRLAQVRSRPRVYYEIDATNATQPITAGPGTFIDQAIHLAYGKNVADGITSCSGTLCYPAFSLEALVKLNPQIIVLGDAAYGTTVDSVKSRGGWSSISAMQTGKVYPFDDELISRAGPRIMIGLQKLARLIHPQAFRG
jgi:iron complex transport system substrate-binding protein